MKPVLRWALIAIISIASSSIVPLYALKDDIIEELRSAKTFHDLSEEAVDAVESGIVSYSELNEDLRKSFEDKKEKRTRSFDLLKAALDNDEDEITRLAALGADVNARDKVGSVLEAAVTGNNDKSVRALIKAGADVSLKTRHGESLLDIAVSNSNVPIIEMLLRAGADSEGVDSFGFTPLLNAIRTERFIVTKALLEHGASVLAADSRGNTALHLAVRLKDNKVVKLLLDHKADPNAQNNVGRTPVDIALHEKIIDCFITLIKGGADLSYVDKHGLTYLAYALEKAEGDQDYVPAVKALIVGMAYDQMLKDPHLQESIDWVVRNIITFQKRLGAPELVVREILYQPEVNEKVALFFFDQLNKGNQIRSPLLTQARGIAKDVLMAKLKPIVSSLRTEVESSAAVRGLTVAAPLARLLDPDKIQENFEPFVRDLIEEKRSANRYAYQVRIQKELNEKKKVGSVSSTAPKQQESLQQKSSSSTSSYRD